MLIYRQLACSTTDCPCQEGPQSPEYVLKFCPVFREARQDHSPQSMFYSSAPSSEYVLQLCPVFRVCSAALPHLQSMFCSSAPSSEYVLQLCPVFRVCSAALPRLQSMFCSPAPSSVLSPFHWSKAGSQSPEYVLQLCPLFTEARQDHSPQSMFCSSVPFSQKHECSSGSMGQHGGPCEDHNLHPNNRTDHLRQNHAQIQQNYLQPLHPSGKPLTDPHSHPLTHNKVSLQLT